MFALALAVALVSSAPNYTGLVWVHSDNCPVCRKMQPVVNKLVAEGAPIIIVKVTTQDELSKHGAQYVPATFAYKNGKLIHQAEQLVSGETLRQWLSEIGGR